MHALVSLEYFLPGKRFLDFESLCARCEVTSLLVNVLCSCEELGETF